MNRPPSHLTMLLSRHTRRRTLLCALGAAMALPLAARAQQKPMPVIGYLSTIASFPALLDEFRRGLAEMGFVEGQNLRIEYRMAAGDYERLPALVAELVRMPVDVIVAAGGSHLGDGGEGRNHKIPIVVISGEDPVKLGLGAKPRPPRRQSHRGLAAGGRGRREALGAAARTGPGRRSDRASGEPDQRGSRAAGRRPRVRGGPSRRRAKVSESQQE